MSKTPWQWLVARSREGDSETEISDGYTGKWHRFAQPDPYDGSYDLTNPQSFNRYAYVQNDPVNFVDPTGMDPQDPPPTSHIDPATGGPASVPGISASVTIGFSQIFGPGSGIGGDSHNQLLLVNDIHLGLLGGGLQDPAPQQPQRNDCTNMADRAQQIANDVINGANAWRGTGAAAMLQRFNRIFATEFAGTYIAEGVLGFIDMPMWSSSQQERADFGQRGFPQHFRDDNYPQHDADQTHHFAAYFSGGLAGHNVPFNLHRSVDNQGDANLGRQAQLLGRYLRRNRGNWATSGSSSETPSVMEERYHNDF